MENNKCGWCDEWAYQLSNPHMFDAAMGQKMCKACWDHDREVYKGSMGEDIGEFTPVVTASLRYFKFEDGEGHYVVVANHAREAINHFFNEYQEDLTLDDALKYEGIHITELDELQINIPGKFHDGATGTSRDVTYKEIYEEEPVPLPVVIVYLVS